MKFFHLSDLHIGKRLYECSLIEDQKYILDFILSKIDEEQPDALLLSGDIYDRSIPSEEAVTLFDDFLKKVVSRKLPIYIISGNHDSGERLGFASSMLQASNIYIAGTYKGSIPHFIQNDDYGPVHIWLLPFIRPQDVRPYLKDTEEIKTYTDAVNFALKDAYVEGERNILLAHQFVTGSIRSDSEEASCGGLDNVDVSVFERYDYVALGHIHRPQACSEHVFYSGTPLKYSFSESSDSKHIPVITLSPNLSLNYLPLTPMRDMAKLTGLFEDLANPTKEQLEKYKNTYLFITLKNKEPIPDVMLKLRQLYPYLMGVDYEYRHTMDPASINENRIQALSPLDLFRDFFENQTGLPLNEEEESALQKVVQDIFEGGNL